MNKSILAGAALLAAGAVAVPFAAWSADAPPQSTATAPIQPGGGDQQGMGEHHHGGGRHWAMRSPRQHCEAGIARRAAMAAYVESMLNLTSEQRPLAAKVETALQNAGDKERQLCAALPTDAKAPSTMMDRLSRRAQMMQARLDGMKQVQPAPQALYAALTPGAKSDPRPPVPSRMIGSWTAAMGFAALYPSYGLDGFSNAKPIAPADALDWRRTNDRPPPCPIPRASP